MTRAQFVEATAELDHDRLRQILWTLYWRGPAAVRTRIEDDLSPSRPNSKGVAPAKQIDADEMLAQVSEFVSLARSGAYLGRDRRVSPKERTRWRYTFKQLSGAARQAMLGERGEAAGDPGLRSGAAAMGLLIDLACEMRGYDYVRSEDPVAAAGLVVSDEVELLWGRMLERDGVDQFARVAMGQLLRWESRYGWTRRGEGPVARRETTLAQVLAGLLVVPDAWEVVTEAYLAALDAAAGGDRQESADVLADWHSVLLDRLTGGPADLLLDRIAGHSALAGPERDFFAANLARRRGDEDSARRLVTRCLAVLPGHPDFRRLADELR